MLSSFRRVLRGIGLVAIAGLVGCPSSNPAKNDQISRPFLGQELDLVVPRSFNLPAIWEVLIQEWSSQSGATTRFVEFDASATPPVQQISSTNSGGSLLLFPLNQLCEIDGQLSPLPMTNGEFDARDIFRGLRERAISREKQLIVSPLSVPVLVCYYRSDLLRAANRKVPETWDEYHELVETIDKWAPGLIAVEPLGPEFRATTFFARSLAFCKHPENYSVWFDIDTAKPTLDSPGFLRALETAQRTWSKLPPEVATYSPAECRRLLLQGKAAIALSFEPRSAELSVTEVQRTDGIEVGVCRLPGSRTVYNRNSKKWDTIPGKGVNAPVLCGFAGLAVGVIRSTNRANESAALNLLSSLSSSPLFDQAFATLPKSPCRESQLMQAPTWFGPELSTEEASQYCDAVAQSLRDPQVVFELPLLGADEFRRATSKCLEPLLRGDADVEQTLHTLQKSFEEIVEQRGWETVRDSHRRGLGLSSVLKK